MISWIKGDLIDSWQTNNKFFVLVNCQDLGYEIQILESIFVKFKNEETSNKNIILWIKQLKKEDSDTFFGFISKDQKDFFNEVLNVKGIGSQIAMALLNKFSIKEIINAINTKDKKSISSVPGIGQKMTERLILELEINLGKKFKILEDNKNKKLFFENREINLILEDIELTLISLNYSKKDIKEIFPILIKEINNSKNQSKILFEDLLKFSMNYLDNHNSILG